MTKITQDDIECWKAIFSLTNEQMDVEGDDKRGLELLAAHREAERRAIVEWLRADAVKLEAEQKQFPTYDARWLSLREQIESAHVYADAIENGEHHVE